MAITIDLQNCKIKISVAIEPITGDIILCELNAKAQQENNVESSLRKARSTAMLSRRNRSGVATAGDSGFKSRRRDAKRLQQRTLQMTHELASSLRVVCRRHTSCPSCSHQATISWAKDHCPASTKAARRPWLASKLCNTNSRCGAR